eukprot:CAMPEP_0114989286 /NCGR_PEP_ID=MMETSP0216-20121206/10109_1 /TAXON_ID=223996 /ORGANISM="Protocruzia adherens, Strain Boccale" /LENGTH=707 /DNA_ID=CAMNT_0002352239 /DNA_START=30 /DNA_END=2153 /DNA_ORIENTATION=-
MRNRDSDIFLESATHISESIQHKATNESKVDQSLENPGLWTRWFGSKKKMQEKDVTEDVDEFLDESFRQNQPRGSETNANIASRMLDSDSDTSLYYGPTIDDCPSFVRHSTLKGGKSELSESQLQKAARESKFLAITKFISPKNKTTLETEKTETNRGSVTHDAFWPDEHPNIDFGEFTEDEIEEETSVVVRTYDLTIYDEKRKELEVYERKRKFVLQRMDYSQIKTSWGLGDILGKHFAEYFFDLDELDQVDIDHDFGRYFRSKPGKDSQDSKDRRSLLIPNRKTQAQKRINEGVRKRENRLRKGSSNSNSPVLSSAGSPNNFGSSMTADNIPDLDLNEDSSLKVSQGVFMSYLLKRIERGSSLGAINLESERAKLHLMNEYLKVLEVNEDHPRVQHNRLYQVALRINSYFGSSVTASNVTEAFNLASIEGVNVNVRRSSHDNLSPSLGASPDTKSPRIRAGSRQIKQMNMNLVAGISEDKNETDPESNSSIDDIDEGESQLGDRKARSQTLRSKASLSQQSKGNRSDDGSEKVTEAEHTADDFYNELMMESGIVSRTLILDQSVTSQSFQKLAKQKVQQLHNSRGSGLNTSQVDTSKVQSNIKSYKDHAIYVNARVVFKKWLKNARDMKKERTLIKKLMSIQGAGQKRELKIDEPDILNRDTKKNETEKVVMPSKADLESNFINVEPSKKILKILPFCNNVFRPK